MDNLVREVGQRMRDFLADTRNFVQQNPPPGKNAGNGHIRALLLSPGMLAYDRMPNGEDLRNRAIKNDAVKLFFAHNYLHFTIRQSFENNANHCTDWNSNIDIVFDNASIFGGIANIIKDIINIIGGDDAAAAALANDLTATIQAIQNNPNVTGGCHLNGFIATYIRDNSNSALNDINGYINQHGQLNDPDVIVMMSIIQQLFRELINLPQHHPVWLTAEWQIKFLAALKAAVYSLDTYLQNNP